MTRKSILRLSAAVGALSVGAHAASAQTTATSADTTAGGGIAEVVVTATKRSENVQSVPQSVYVATKATLDRANVRDFDDIATIAPDLTITKTTQPFTEVKDGLFNQLKQEKFNAWITGMQKQYTPKIDKPEYFKR